MSGHIDEDEYERQEYEESDLEEFDLENDLQEGEVNLFASMPWINENIGSMIDAQLLQFGSVQPAARSQWLGPHYCSFTLKDSPLNLSEAG